MTTYNTINLKKKNNKDNSKILFRYYDAQIYLFDVLVLIDLLGISNMSTYCTHCLCCCEMQISLCGE